MLEISIAWAKELSTLNGDGDDGGNDRRILRVYGNAPRGNVRSLFPTPRWHAKCRALAIPHESCA